MKFLPIHALIPNKSAISVRAKSRLFY